MPTDDTRRAAIYARFSTDLQSDRSIADQVALCRGYADRTGLTVAAVYSDRAKTSASIIGRDGLLDMLAAAKDGAFDVIVVEALDRISRDQGDLATIHKRLSFAGIGIETAHGGAATELEIGVQGLLGQLWLAQLKDKIRRGQAGVIRDGRHAGGRAFGYRPIPGQAGRLEIVQAEAEIVRRIFADYASGLTPREIAARLNAEGVPAPRGDHWNASTLNGNPARGYGILRNDLYRGRIVWNRVRMVRDPDTGRRVSRTNPPEDWQTVEAEELRIVPDTLFEAAQRRKASRTGGPAVGAAGNAGRRAAAPRRPFSGLLRCGDCGGGMSVLRKDKSGAVYARCSTAKESGSCGQRRTVRLDHVEAAIFARLRGELSDPVYLRAYLAEYHAERTRIARAAHRDRAQLDRTASKARAAYDRAHRLYVEGVTDGDEARTQIRQLLDAARQAEAARDAASTEVQVVELHPAAADRYLDALAGLADYMGDARSDTARRAVETLRELVDRVVVTIRDDGTDVQVEGRLSALLGEDHPVCRGTMVAEEGLEPPTRGL